MKEARGSFNPCVWRTVIFLCGAFSATIEAFSPDTETFLSFCLLVPQNNSGCCLYVDQDQLVVHSYDHVRKYAMREGEVLQVKEELTPAAGKLQNSQPVVDRNQGLFYLVYRGDCLRFNMETGVQVLIS